eukprot:TRINITY_DN95632_c0_g1_i1.p1 TRINITY_DN95632_c0_g1~~TRINITY_DN95632_c0_g1_i1.p1  ORF type:complete len:362 (-),score=86.25 TRINITY_DN95632_c0_g1_i1:139-1122(-)
MADKPDPEVLAKKGAELFKEILRLYPEAEVEDYYRGGSWKDDILLCDYRLFVAHRSEAGADDPPPLEEVKMPYLPDQPQPAARPVLNSAAMAVMADLRLIAVFVAKHKLDAMKTKAALQSLTLHQKKHVMSNFKMEEGADKDSIQALTAYVKECQTTKAWGDEPAADAAEEKPPATTVKPGVVSITPVTEIASPAPTPATATSADQTAAEAPPKTAAKVLTVKPVGLVGQPVGQVVQAVAAGVKRPGLVTAEGAGADKRPKVAEKAAEGEKAAAPAGLKPGGVIGIRPVTPRPAAAAPAANAWGGKGWGGMGAGAWDAWGSGNSWGW